ncbi:MAG: disulfide bond formation protein B [Rhodospirillales bacterium]
MAVLLAGVGALVAAFVGQFVFGLEPCILCLYQRIPYFAVAVVALAGVALPLSQRQRLRLLALSGAIFAVGAGLALYHVGIEEHWWTSPIPGCVGTPVGTMTMDEFKQGLVAPIRPCDRVDWRLSGLSLAGWNAVVSVLLAAACLWLARSLQQRRTG